jgi:hypothetical protein
MTEAEALEKILKELQQLRADLVPTRQPLGFGEAPKSEVWIFCNREKGGYGMLLMAKVNLLRLIILH